MSLLSGIFSLGFVGGVQLGKLLHNYTVRFLVSTLFCVLGLLYSIFILKEPANQQHSCIETQSISKRAWTHFTESLKTVLAPRKDGGRLKLLILIMSFLSLTLCQYTTDFDFLMTSLKFHWDSRDFSNYLTIQRIWRLTSLFVLVPE